MDQIVPAESADPPERPQYNLSDELAWLYSALSSYLSIPRDGIRHQVLSGEALCELVSKAWGIEARPVPASGSPGSYEFSSAAARNFASFTSACRARGMPESILFEYSEFNSGQPRAKHACCQCVYEVLRTCSSGRRLLKGKGTRPPESISSYTDSGVSSFRRQQLLHKGALTTWLRRPLVGIATRAAYALAFYFAATRALASR